MSAYIPSGNAEETHAEDGKSARVMVVEDGRIVARDLAATLVELGYEVVAIASSGEEAVTTARALRPDLILMDIRLAGRMDGIEASSIIRGEQDTRVIYLTAHSDNETLRRAGITEPLAYLVKPFAAVELKRSIEISLYGYETSSATTAPGSR